jgi:flagellar hook-associated protein 1 FlgK
MASPLSNGVSGLLAAQRAIATSSHNVANANTPGFTRQQVINATRNPDRANGLTMGTGVTTESIQRIHSEFTESRLRSSATELNRIDTINGLNARMDNLFADASSGLNTAQANFYNAIADASVDPSSPVARKAVLAAADEISRRFSFFDSQFSSMQQELNQKVEASVSRINQLATSIAELNQTISSAGNTSAGSPNDLLDKRDQLLAELAEQTSIATTRTGNYGLNVTTGTGITLVSNGEATALVTTASNEVPGDLVAAIATDSGVTPINDQLSGGILGGINDFRRETLTTTRNEVGLLASVFAINLNEQHAQGFDAEGLAGGNLFNIGAISTHASSSNTSSATARADVTDVSQLQASDYQMRFDGVEYTLTRLTDNQQISGGNNLIMDGIAFSVDGTANAGDSFLFRPTANSAGSFSTAISNIDRLAFAETTTAGVGDVGNARALADLQAGQLFDNRQTTFAQKLAGLVTTVGGTAEASSLQLDSMQQVWQFEQDQHDSLSGVNLDEEAVNLVKYQQAYEASAQVITVASRLFDTLIGTLGRL